MCKQFYREAESIGMLQCVYHPHVHGAHQPQKTAFADKSTLEKCMPSAGGCHACASTYVGASHLLNTERAGLSGCTGIDHIGVHEDTSLHDVLLQQPYRLIPLAAWEEGSNMLHAQQYNVYPRRRIPHRHTDRAVVFEFRKRADIVDEQSDEHKCLQIRLHGDDERDDKHLLNISLVELYNECADEHGYAHLDESSWTQRVLHANRFYMDDANGGLASMTADEVLTREAYADEFDVDSGTDFVPFVAVLRVECRHAQVIDAPAND